MFHFPSHFFGERKLFKLLERFFCLPLAEVEEEGGEGKSAFLLISALDLEPTFRFPFNCKGIQTREKLLALLSFFQPQKKAEKKNTELDFCFPSPLFPEYGVTA